MRITSLSSSETICGKFHPCLMKKLTDSLYLQHMEVGWSEGGRRDGQARSMVVSHRTEGMKERKEERERDKDAFHSSFVPSFAVPERWKGRTMGDKTRQLINRERENKGGEQTDRPTAVK